MTTQPKLLQLYECVSANPFPVGSRHRLIWFARDENLATLIRTDQPNLTKPKTVFFHKVEEYIDERLLVAVEEEESIPQLKLSDDALTSRYPARNRKPREDGTRPQESYPLQYRKLWTPIVREISPHLTDVWRGKTSLLSIIRPVCEKYDVCENEAYQVLYRYLANKNSERSIVPRTYDCGNPEETRVGRGFNLGRKKLAISTAQLPNDNFPLDDEWLKKIQDIYRSGVNEGVSGKECYRQFKNVHCVEKWEVIDGKPVLKYFPDGSYPSERQFLTHGPGDDLKEQLFYKKHTPLEYELNFRALDGYREPLTTRAGLIAQVDASSNDEHLVSVFDCHQALGTCRTILVVEEGTSYIWGIHPTWRVNKEAAKLSTLNAASDKTAFCARYGIRLKPGDWYRHLHSQILGDKGEFNCEPVRDTYAELNCSIEYTETGRGDQKGTVEFTHKPLHNHGSKSSTKGRNRKRGEKDPAQSAHKNMFQYTRELIRRVIYHNNFEPVPHLLTTEMRQAGVPATRRAILEFCIEHGYFHEHHYDDDDLVIELCPEFDATVTPDGVYPVVKRNLDSGDEIMLDDLRYLGKFVEEHHWLELARRKGRWRIKIRMNPNDPRKAWYQDPDEGLQELMLASRDPLMGKLASLYDVLHWRGTRTIREEDLNQQAERELANIELQEKAESAAIIKLQSDSAEKNTNGKKLKGASAKNRRAAQKREVEASGQSPTPVQVSASKKSQTECGHGDSKKTTGNDSATAAPQSPVPKDNVIPLDQAGDGHFNKMFDHWLNSES